MFSTLNILSQGCSTRSHYLSSSILHKLQMKTITIPSQRLKLQKNILTGSQRPFSIQSNAILEPVKQVTEIKNELDNTPPLKMMFPPEVSFYRRKLGEELTHLNSIKGRQLFMEAMRDQTMELYFPMSEHFITQSEPSYCALSTLTMCINAMSVDPGYTWRRPWRWANDEVVACCVNLEEAKMHGITFAQFTHLARCQGLHADSYFAEDTTIDHFRSEVLRLSRQSSLVATGFASDSCSPPLSGAEHVTQPPNAPPHHSYAFLEHNTNTSDTPALAKGGLTECIAVSFSRKGLSQTGDGHMSPIAGYHIETDQVLVMDVARFKYPPYWVPLEMLWESMLPIDKFTGRSRGFSVLTPQAFVGHEDGCIHVEDGGKWKIKTERVLASQVASPTTDNTVNITDSSKSI